VGPFTALVLLAEIGDISCFGPARKLASWAGLTPTIRGCSSLRSPATACRASSSSSPAPAGAALRALRLDPRDRATAQTGSDEESHKLVPPDPGGQR
jgi:hypothetical protein